MGPLRLAIAVARSVDRSVARSIAASSLARRRSLGTWRSSAVFIARPPPAARSVDRAIARAFGRRRRRRSRPAALVLCMCIELLAFASRQPAPKIIQVVWTIYLSASYTLCFYVSIRQAPCTKIAPGMPIAHHRPIVTSGGSALTTDISVGPFLTKKKITIRDLFFFIKKLKNVSCEYNRLNG